MRAVLAQGRPFRFCARGWSMSPFIKDGDLITVAPIRPAACGIGEVVAFVMPANDRLVVHRIIGRHESRLLVHGDSLPRPTADLVNPADVIGRVARVERGRRRVWLGLGLERYAIAVLSRVGLLLPILLRAGGLARWLRKQPNDNN